MAAATALAATRVREALMRAANKGGGWPYYAEKGSRIEPTCWALLALAEADPDGDNWQRMATPHLAWLTSIQGRDGLLIDVPGAPPNFTANGLAACVLAGSAFRAARPEPVEGRAPDLARLGDELVTVKGLSVDIPDPRQDNRLQGWPWMPDTFSWIEPTCWCLLALKKGNAASSA